MKFVGHQKAAKAQRHQVAEIYYNLVRIFPITQCSLIELVQITKIHAAVKQML